jgi:GH24 family phage-related lysozyme (muramidase)
MSFDRLGVQLIRAVTGVFLTTAPLTVGLFLPHQQATPAIIDCRPLVFPAGSQNDVVAKAADFLTKVETVQQHPYWPGGNSGVTLGIGWDLGQHNRVELQLAWAALSADSLERLEAAAGKKGAAAQALIPQLKSIEVPADVSKQVLSTSLDKYYYPFVTNQFSGLKELPTEAQVVLISLVFNRGVSMGHEPDWRFAKEVDRRWEFRELRRDIKEGDMFAIYAHLGTMKRLWEKSGPRGLPIRRRDEQALIRPYVDKQLKWEEKCRGRGNPRPQ